MTDRVVRKQDHARARAPDLRKSVCASRVSESVSKADKGSEVTRRFVVRDPLFQGGEEAVTALHDRHRRAFATCVGSNRGLGAEGLTGSRAGAS